MTKPDTQPGYKNTELGWIPAEWELKRLSDLVGFKNGKAHEGFITDFGKYVVINSKFVSTEGEVFKTSDICLSGLEINDIVIVMSDIPNGKALAKCFLVDKQNFYTLNQRIGGLTSQGPEPKYLFYQLNRNPYFLGFDSGSGQTNLRRQEVLECPVKIPKSISEQQAIATALSDMDGYIRSLEQLIEKKKAIKQAAMQELLTPKGDWEVRKFEDVIDGFSSGMTPYRGIKDYYSGKIPWITSGELNYNLILDTEEKITEEAKRRTNLKLLPKGTFLMAITGLEAEGTRGSCGITGIEATTNQSCMALFPKKNKLTTEYLFHYYVKYGDDLALQYCQGTKQQSYTGRIVKKMPIAIPPTIEEQNAIASTLTEMDVEINDSLIKLQKIKRIKQAMMQDLLTGKVRLV